MKKEYDDLMLELGEITELQECMVDVLENCMYKDKKPYYALTLMNIMKDRSNTLYEDFDMFNVL